MGTAGGNASGCLRDACSLQKAAYLKGGPFKASLSLNLKLTYYVQIVHKDIGLGHQGASLAPWQRSRCKVLFRSRSPQLLAIFRSQLFRSKRWICR